MLATSAAISWQFGYELVQVLNLVQDRRPAVHGDFSEATTKPSSFSLLANTATRPLRCLLWIRSPRWTPRRPGSACRQSRKNAGVKSDTATAISCWKSRGAPSTPGSLFPEPLPTVDVGLDRAPDPGLHWRDVPAGDQAGDAKRRGNERAGPAPATSHQHGYPPANPRPVG